MSRFTDRLRRADRRIDRMFGEEVPVNFIIGGEQRPVSAIFENPDASFSLAGGGGIRDASPAVSVYTTDISGLNKRDEVVIRGTSWWVTKIGTDEDGRTRIELAHGKPGRPVSEIDKWS